jgi:hypothetical protein
MSRMLCSVVVMCRWLVRYGGASSAPDNSTPAIQNSGSSEQGSDSQSSSQSEKTSSGLESPEPCQVPMSPSLSRALGAIVVWGVVLWGALSIARLPGDWGHGVCGPWGCGPPLQALLACHLSWLVVLLPLAGVLRLWLPCRQQRVLGMIVLVAGCVGLGGLVAYELTTWWPAVSEWQRHFFWQRIGFVIATQVDLPVIELILTGVCLLTGARSGRIRGIPSASESATCLALPQNPSSPTASTDQHD